MKRDMKKAKEESTKCVAALIKVLEEKQSKLCQDKIVGKGQNFSGKN